ncbi:hypothetical protein KIN20_014018 [Parelaphostrongylus tenuis]|uniref:Uncharacterized protein n=1 Tax=Parelaphostrongylus tenuis TaxID=148309 RepID=A0AAD5QLE5_PARTN|nr:hypothetical protein KIN20_014018 [Parelaphostrongylus tenuis]
MHNGLYFCHIEAISVISTATSPRKLSHERVKKMQIDHGDFVSSLGSSEIERKVKTLRDEINNILMPLVELIKYINRVDPLKCRNKKAKCDIVISQLSTAALNEQRMDIC